MIECEIIASSTYLIDGVTVKSFECGPRFDSVFLSKKFNCFFPFSESKSKS